MDATAAMSDIAPVFAAADADSDWLTRVLRASGLLGDGHVSAVRFDTCGTGQLGDSFRFSLDYDPPRAGPETLVGKFASADPTSRAFGRASGYYRSEIRFYQWLAPTLPVAVPDCVYAALAPDEAEFVLLMHDLVPARQVDQLVGCSAEDNACVLAQAAVYHARTWRSPTLAAESWLKGPVAMFGQVTDQFAGVVERFPELCGDLVGTAELKEAARLIDHADAWKRVLSDPQCLWHSDLRADNVMFDTGGGAAPVTLLDWQGVGYGRGTIDVAYWLGTSMAPSERRLHERELLQCYHAVLLENGVRDYPFEQCWRDYRIHALHGLQVGVFGLGAVKRTPRGDCMWKHWIECCAEQVRELSSYDALTEA